MTNDKLLSTGDVATRANVTRQSVHYWAATGKLLPVLEVGGRRLFAEADVVAFLAAREATG
jgi:DNA-binding transcriptional MerR regulator